MEKYFESEYNRRMGGNYCVVYDENVNKVRTVKGCTNVEGLQRIVSRTSIITALLVTEPLNDKWLLVKGHEKMTDEQLKNVFKNIR